ncbi:MAG: hypothetical protein ACUVTX_02625 [Bacteroidales bacterium]
MKTKIYIGILGALLTPGLLAEAQIADARNFRNDDAGIVINNYYNYDFYYSSRINRFHRSYVAFNYYSPVFTDVYWYNYQPFTWGFTIYGGGRIGIGMAYNYPIFYSYWDYPWYYGWDYGWYGGTYYWGYDPFYINWYRPVIVNIRIGNWWPRTYYGYNIRHHWFADYRPVYNTYNYYYYNTSGRSNTGSDNFARRNVPPASASVLNRREVVTPSAGNQTSTDNQNRRGIPSGNQGNQNNRIHQGDRGNNNSLDPGNTNNVNRGVNSGNNPGRRSTSSSNNGNQDNVSRQVISMPSGARSQTGVVTPSRPSETRSAVTDRPSTINTGRNVTRNSQPAVSQSSRRTVTSSPAVRSRGNVSRSVQPAQSSSRSNTSKSSESKKSNSENNTASRRK